MQLWKNPGALASSVRYQRTDGHCIREGLTGGMNPQKHLEFSSLALWCPAALQCISEKITADPLLQRWSHESIIRSAALSGGLKCSSLLFLRKYIFTVAQRHQHWSSTYWTELFYGHNYAATLTISNCSCSECSKSSYVLNFGFACSKTSTQIPLWTETIGHIW